MTGRKKLCVLCGHAVGQGDRHAANACPPPPGIRGDHRRRARRHKKKKRDEAVPVRGITVGGLQKRKRKT